MFWLKPGSLGNINNFIIYFEDSEMYNNYRNIIILKYFLYFIGAQHNQASKKFMKNV